MRFLHSPWVFAALALAPAASLSAQTSFARVEILNTTKMAGAATADVVLPLEQGRLREVPSLITDRGRICHVRALGARWPDQSLRYLRVDLPVEVTAEERRTVALQLYSGAKPTFREHPTITAQLGLVQTWFRAAGKRVQFTNPELIEDTPRMRVYRSGIRIPDSSIWAQLDLLVMHNTPHVRFYLQWGLSNPNRPELHENPGIVAFETKGAKFLFEEPDSKLHEQYDLVGEVQGNLLHNDGFMADGQSQCMEGRIFFGAGAPRVRAMAHGWERSGAFGPFGELVASAPVDPTWWKERIAFDEVAQVRQPWASPLHGCLSSPGITGSQRDFGTMVMRPDLLEADPSRLRSIARSVFQEWCRPTHFRETDLQPVTAAQHPQLYTWTGRPHFALKQTQVDMLGKPIGYLDGTKITYDENRHVFGGHDSEHISVNYLTAFALTTGDRMAIEECSHQAELFVTAFTAMTFPVGNPGAARSIGRSLLAGSWLWLVTGRADVETCVVGRAERAIATYHNPRTGVEKLLPKLLVPRYNEDRSYYWPPWEESIAAVGLCAVDALFNKPDARSVAISMSENIVMHGFGWADGGWRAGYKLPIEGPENSPYQAAFDPDFARHAGGAGLTRWTMPAVLLAAVYSPDSGIRNVSTYLLFELLLDPRVSGDQGVFEWISVLPKSQN